MSEKKKRIRAAFRDAVYNRDKYCCRNCGKQFTVETAQDNLDAHHITDRHEMPNGGYVKSNGISLCKHGNPSCHEMAEKNMAGLTATELYIKIGSSYKSALKESQEL